MAPRARAARRGVVTGGVIGIVNGAMITMLRVVPFIVTLGMLGIARGVAKWLAHEQTVNVPATWLNDLLVTFPKPAWLVLPIGVWVDAGARRARRARARAHRVRPAHLRARLQRSGGARLRYRTEPAEDRDLRDRRAVCSGSRA